MSRYNTIHAENPDYYHTIELYNNVCPAFDHTDYFFCTKCIYVIRMHHSYRNNRSFVENDTGHDYGCFHKIDIYFEERKMLPNEFIVYFRELCNCFYYSYCRFLRNDLIRVFLSRSKRLKIWTFVKVLHVCVSIN